MLATALAEDWPFARLDPVLRALLRAGAAELSMADGPPARVVINEYLDVAHGFFDGDEPRMANGVLDRLARLLRPPTSSTPRCLTASERRTPPAEFALIARHFRPLAGPGALDLLDDAAVLRRPPGVNSSSPPTPWSAACISCPTTRPTSSRASCCAPTSPTSPPWAPSRSAT